MADIDLYEFKENLDKIDLEETETDWLKPAEDKQVCLVEVSKAPEHIKKQLEGFGYDRDDVALIIIQN